MKIPAIVMTCQKYAPFVEHMMTTYTRLWPDHPFCFWLPDGEAMRSVASRSNAPIRLVQTSEGDQRGRFRACVLDLISELDDEDWIYWCIDDKYPVWLDTELANTLVGKLPSMAPEICSLSLMREQKLKKTRPAGHNAKIRIEKSDFVSVGCLSRFWYHQFYRVKVIRHVFEVLPEVIEQAKTMDGIIKKLTVNDNWLKYVSVRPAAYCGESAARGKITRNCSLSMEKLGIACEGFEMTDSKFCGKKPSLFQRVRGFDSK